MSKPFSKTLYEANDPKAKETWIKVLEKQKYVIELSEEDRFNTDVVAFEPNTNKKICFELETRANHHYENIVKAIYPDVTIPFRKIMHKNISDWYIGMNQSYTKCFRIKMSKIIEFSNKMSHIVQKPCVVEGKKIFDDFVKVPREYIEFLKIDENGRLSSDELEN